MNWSGELLKVVVYPAELSQDAGELYELVTNSSPDIVARAKLPPPLMSQASGDSDGLGIAVIVQPGRLELVLTNLDPEPTQPSPIPLMSAELLNEATSRARAYAKRLHSLGKVHRAAGHAQLVQDADSAENATKLVNDIVGNAFPESARDVLFQLNVRREFKGGGTMNRIVKVGQTSLISVQVNLDVAAQRMPTTRGGQRHLAYMHLDLNSKHEDVAFEAERANEMSEDIWDEIQRIRERGLDVLG